MEVWLEPANRAKNTSTHTLRLFANPSEPVLTTQVLLRFVRFIPFATLRHPNSSLDQYLLARPIQAGGRCSPQDRDLAEMVQYIAPIEPSGGLPTLRSLARTGWLLRSFIDEAMAAWQPRFTSAYCLDGPQDMIVSTARCCLLK